MGLLRKYCVIYYHVIERKSQERKIGKTINYKTYSLNVYHELYLKINILMNASFIVYNTFTNFNLKMQFAGH